MTNTTCTLDERPLPGEDPAKSMRYHAKIMIWSCIGMFLFVCLMASTGWQQRKNEAALNFENSSLRQRLNAESKQRRALETQIEQLTKVHQ